jgi:hypothetical protein
MISSLSHFCRSWLASDGGLKGYMDFEAVIAGKPAPTEFALMFDLHDCAASSVHARVGCQAIDRPVELVQCHAGFRILLLEQGFAALAGRPQLRYAAVTRRAMQAMDPFDQGVVVVALLSEANGFAVCFQGREQHRQHVRRQISLAGGQAQSFLVVEYQ